MAGASIAFYALIGFEDAVNVAEETKDSTHTFPRTLFLGLGIAGTIYLLVTIVAGMAVPADKRAESDGPLLEVVALGPLALNSKVFSAIALFALINGCLLNLVMASRLMYGMALENLGIVTCAALAVHSILDDPQLLLWAGGLIALGLVLWVIERAVR